MKRLLMLLLAALSITGIQAASEKTKQVDGGCSGPLKAIAVKDSEIPDFVIYRPQDMLLAHARQGALPVLMWGDTLKIAAAGHSCGGAQVLANAADSRLKTCLIMNAGMGDIEIAGDFSELCSRNVGRRPQNT